MILPLICKESELKTTRNSSDFEFLSRLPFGMVVFPLGTPSLPASINSSDCDGDRFFVIWDESIVHEASCTQGVIADDFVYHKDELVGTTICCKSEGTKSEAGVIVGKAKDGESYLVEVESKPIRVEVWSKKDLFDGRGYMKEVIAHRIVKGKTEFHIEWEGGAKNKLFSSDIKRNNINPPAVLLAYVDRNNLLKSKDCHWFKQHLDDRKYTRTLTKIIDHRSIDGDVEVLCQYDDNHNDWELLKDHKIESKLLVGKYAKDKSLTNKREWRTQNLWFEEIQESIILNRSYKTNLLVERSCRMWKESFAKLGPNSAETKIWGRAYKEANMLEKHGGYIELPLVLYRRIVGKNEKNCKFLEFLKPIDAYVWPPLTSESNCSEEFVLDNKDKFTNKLSSDRDSDELFSASDDEGKVVNGGSNKADGDDSSELFSTSSSNNEDDGWGRTEDEGKVEDGCPKSKVDGDESEELFSTSSGDNDDDGWGRRG